MPQPTFLAILAALDAFGKQLRTMKPEESLWPSSTGSGLGVTSGTFYGNLRRYFQAAGMQPAGVHIFRHSAAKLRRDAGESVEQVSRFLAHSSLAVTTVYLRRLEGDRDTTWREWLRHWGFLVNVDLSSSHTSAGARGAQRCQLPTPGPPRSTDQNTSLDIKHKEAPT